MSCVVDSLPTVQFTKDLVEAALMSKYVKRQPHEPSISLLLIAPPSSGKSFTLKRYAGNRGVQWQTEFTAQTLIEMLAKSRQRELTLIVPDLARLIRKKGSTAKNLESTLLVALEDGVKEVNTLSLKVKFKQPKRVQLLTALPSTYFKWKRQIYSDLGLLDRFICTDVSYSAKELEVIEDAILREEQFDSSPIKLNFPKQPIEVKLSPKILKILQQKACKITLRSLRNTCKLLQAATYNLEEKGLKLENTSFLNRLLEATPSTLNWVIRGGTGGSNYSNMPPGFRKLNREDEDEAEP